MKRSIERKIIRKEKRAWKSERKEEERPDEVDEGEGGGRNKRKERQ